MTTHRFEVKKQNYFPIARITLVVDKTLALAMLIRGEEIGILNLASECEVCKDV